MPNCTGSVCVTMHLFLRRAADTCSSCQPLAWWRGPSPTSKSTSRKKQGPSKSLSRVPGLSLECLFESADFCCDCSAYRGWHTTSHVRMSCTFSSDFPLKNAGRNVPEKKESLRDKVFKDKRSFCFFSQTPWTQQLSCRARISWGSQCRKVAPTCVWVVKNISQLLYFE